MPASLRNVVMNWLWLEKPHRIATSVSDISRCSRRCCAYPPLNEYMMTPETEAALARSAAPEAISGHATVKILTASGYKVATKGDNGFVCLVMRGWGARRLLLLSSGTSFTTRNSARPICFNPVASRTVLPLQELRTKLGMEGKTPDQIAEAVQAAYAEGALPRMEIVAFAYMFSANQDLGPGVGHWHPHMMVYTPYYENSMLGGKVFRSIDKIARVLFDVVGNNQQSCLLACTYTQFK